MRIRDIVLISPILDISGTAEVGRNLFFSLMNLGLKVKLVDVPYWSHLKAELSPEDRDMIEFGLNRNDINDPVAIHFYPPDPFRGLINVGARTNISYTVFETDKCPILWRDILNNPQFSEVWVACDFQKEAYASQGVDRHKIKVVPFGVNTDKFNPGVGSLEIEGRKKFAFGTAFDWSVRKNPEGILGAFLQEFNKEQDACLVLKSYTGYGDEAAADGIKNEIKRMRAMIKSNANILFLRKYLPDSKIPMLHNSVDAWVNLSRGEGWDLGSIQSIACGVPVIASDNTSHKVYLNNDNSYLVSCQKTQIINQEFLTKSPQFLGHSWYEPNLKDARKQMRLAYEDWKTGDIDKKKKQARADSLGFNWKNTAIKILFEITKYQ